MQVFQIIQAGFHSEVSSHHTLQTYYLKSSLSLIICS